MACLGNLNPDFMPYVINPTPVASNLSDLGKLLEMAAQRGNQWTADRGSEAIRGQEINQRAQADRDRNTLGTLVANNNAQAMAAELAQKASQHGTQSADSLAKTTLLGEELKQRAEQSKSQLNLQGLGLLAQVNGVLSNPDPNDVLNQHTLVDADITRQVALANARLAEKGNWLTSKDDDSKEVDLTDLPGITWGGKKSGWIEKPGYRASLMQRPSNELGIGIRSALMKMLGMELPATETTAPATGGAAVAPPSAPVAAPNFGGTPNSVMGVNPGQSKYIVSLEPPSGAVAGNVARPAPPVAAPAPDGPAFIARGRTPAPRLGAVTNDTSLSSLWQPFLEWLSQRGSTMQDAAQR